MQVSMIDSMLRGGPEDRKAAASGLGQYANINSVAVLVDALINDVETEVRAAAAKSLGEIADAGGYEVLLRAIAFEHDEEVVAAATEAAEIIKAKVSEEELPVVSAEMPPMNTGEEILGQYLEELRFGEAGVRKSAADKLGNYPGTQSVTALVDTLINDAHIGAREEAAESLGQIGDRMALPFLKWAEIYDPDKLVRDDAGLAIKKIYDKII